MNALASELIKLRAYRTTAWLFPLVLFAMAGIGAFSLFVVVDSLKKGAPVADQVPIIAFAPGSGTLISGMVLAVFVTITVTADYTSKVANLSLMALPRRASLFGAKTVIGVGTAVLVSVLGVVAVTLAGFLMLPAEAFRLGAASPVTWGNILGVLTSHLIWATMALGLALVLRRSAPTLGVLLVIMLGTPAVAAALRSFDLPQVAKVLDVLPPGLMNAATVTGADAATTIHAVPASLGLTAWSVVFVALGWWGFRRPA